MPSTPLFAPREFFAQRSPSLTSAVPIILLTGVVGLAVGVPIAYQDPSIDMPAGILVLGALLGGVILAAIVWVVLTILVQVLGSVLGGTGGRKQIAANVGWASLPLLITNAIVTLTISIRAFFGPGRLVAATDPQLLHWIVLFRGLITVVGLLWVGYFLTYAIQDAHQLTVRRSALIAGLFTIPIVLDVIVRLLESTL